MIFARRSATHPHWVTNKSRVKNAPVFESTCGPSESRNTHASGVLDHFMIPLLARGASKRVAPPRGPAWPPRLLFVLAFSTVLSTADLVCCALLSADGTEPKCAPRGREPLHSAVPRCSQSCPALDEFFVRELASRRCRVVSVGVTLAECRGVAASIAHFCSDVGSCKRFLQIAFWKKLQVPHLQHHAERHWEPRGLRVPTITCLASLCERRNDHASSDVEPDPEPRHDCQSGSGGPGRFEGTRRFFILVLFFIFCVFGLFTANNFL